jgi:hypothetical protein
MCKTYEKLVEKLWVFFGKFRTGLMEKFGQLNSLWETRHFSTNFFVISSQPIFLNLPLKISPFSPLSTTLTATTKLKKGIE